MTLQKPIEDAMADLLEVYKRLDAAVYLQDRPHVQGPLLRAIAARLRATSDLVSSEAGRVMAQPTSL